MHYDEELRHRRIAYMYEIVALRPYAGIGHCDDRNEVCSLAMRVESAGSKVCPQLQIIIARH